MPRATCLVADAFEVGILVSRDHTPVWGDHHMYVLYRREVEAQRCEVLDLPAPHHTVFSGFGFDFATKPNDGLNVGLTQAALLHPLERMLGELSFRCLVFVLKLSWHLRLLNARKDTPEPGQEAATEHIQLKQRLAFIAPPSHHHF